MNLLAPLALTAAASLSGYAVHSIDAQTPEVIAQQLLPKVERGVGLPFKRPPKIAVRTRAEVHGYLRRKLDSDLPPDELAYVEEAYRLFRLIPDTLDLRDLLLALYTEQVVGFYDPDSSALYLVKGADPAQLKVVLAHELVHALQGQYLPLESILALRHQSDRRTAAQATMEGQATFVQLTVMSHDREALRTPEVWRAFGEQVRQQQERMPVFNSAPLVVREGLIFPYLAGADFVRWFGTVFTDTVPFGRRLPTSTEQILHPDRYLKDDAPVELRFIGKEPPLYDDNLGEFEVRLLLTVLSGSESLAIAGGLGWGGDRYALFQAPEEEFALVWWSVWDDPSSADRFANVLQRNWKKSVRPFRRSSVDRLPVGAHPGVRFVDAPPQWKGWSEIPRVVVK